MTVLHSDFLGKTCLVTGGVGFIGSHLCSRLFDIGAQVISADMEAEGSGAAFKILNENKNIQSLVLDLSESSSIQKIIDLKPDYIFHLCGLPYAPITSVHPNGSFRSNVVSTSNMLEAAKNVSASRFILASSACVFGATLESPIPVDGRRYKPEHFYTYTKRQAENLAESYSEFFDIAVSICRFVNVYGPGDRHFGRLIPALCRQLINSVSDDLTLFRSSGESIYEFLYVEDAVLGLIKAAQHNYSNYDIYHFGPGPSCRRKAIDIANKLSILYDKRERKINIKTIGGEKTVEKYLDINDTLNKIGWKSIWDLESGLSSTIEWYRENINRISPINYDRYSF